MYKITHTGEDINWVNGADKPGAENLYLPVSECGDVINHSYLYKIVAGQCVLRDDYPELTQIRDAEIAASKLRVDEIIQAQNSAGYREYTVEQALEYISNRLDTAPLVATASDLNSASDLPELRDAMITSLTEVKKLINNVEVVISKLAVYVLK